MSNVSLFKAKQDASKAGYLELKKGDVLLKLGTDKRGDVARNLRTGREGNFEYKRVEYYEDAELEAKFEEEMTKKKKEDEAAERARLEKEREEASGDESEQEKAREEEKSEHEKSARKASEQKTGFVRGYIQDIDFVGGEIHLSEDKQVSDPHVRSIPELNLTQGSRRCSRCAAVVS